MLWDILINRDGEAAHQKKLQDASFHKRKSKRLTFLSTVDQVVKLRREYSFIVFYPEAKKINIQLALDVDNRWAGFLRIFIP